MPAFGKNMAIRDKKSGILKVATVSLILVFAFALRVNGIFDDYHTDENAVMSPVEEMSKAFSLDPNYYKRPNHVSIFLNFYVQNAYSVVRYHTLMKNAYDGNVREFFAVARVLNALIGTLMVYLAFLVGKEFSGRAGIFSAFLFAIFPVFVDHAHRITPDVPSACLTMGMIWLSIRLIRRYDGKTMLLLCALGALNIIEKYPGLISVSLVYLVIWFRVRGESPERFWKTLFVELVKYTAIGVFMCYVFSPSLFIHPRLTIKALISESGGHLGVEELGLLGNMGFYAGSFALYAGLIAIPFILAGATALFRRNDRKAFIPILYGFVYWVAMSLVKIHWVRWALPIYVTPILLAAIGLDWLISNRRLALASATLFVVFSVNEILTSISLAIWYDMKSTLAVATGYVAANGITKDNTIYEGYTPFYPLLSNKPLDWAEKKDDPTYKYVILDSSLKDRYMADPERDPERVRAYREITAGQLINSFVPADLPELSPFAVVNILRQAKYLKTAFDEGISTRMKGHTLWIYGISRP